jgi:hypothetical protein
MINVKITSSDVRTNGDTIRAMTNEQLAKWLSEVDVTKDLVAGEHWSYDEWLNWLNQKDV